MIKIENIETYGWAAAIRGMRNPKNSWHISDSKFNEDIEMFTDSGAESYSIPALDIGEKDMKLMKTLRDSGTDHRKFMRMLTVTMDITAPLYWWKEFDTYKIGTVANSCSTMHKIDSRDLTLDDFSTDQLNAGSMDLLSHIIDAINFNRKCFVETKEKEYWWQMIQLLPESYNQKRTVQMNYEVLAHIYNSRRYHKQDEWRNFCSIVKEQLPYSDLFTLEDVRE